MENEAWGSALLKGVKSQTMWGIKIYCSSFLSTSSLVKIPSSAIIWWELFSVFGGRNWAPKMSFPLLCFKRVPGKKPNKQKKTQNPQINNNNNKLTKKDHENAHGGNTELNIFFGMQLVFLSRHRRHIFSSKKGQVTKTNPLESKCKSHEITAPCSHSWEFGRALLMPWCWHPMNNSTSNRDCEHCWQLWQECGQGERPCRGKLWVQLLMLVHTW